MPRRISFIRPTIILLGLLGLAALAAAQSGEPKVAVGSHILVAESKTVTLRAEADSDSKALASLPEFTPMEVLADAGEYWKVKTAGGTVGHAHKDYVASSPYVVVSGSVANIRSGPEYSDAVKFQVKENYPLKVLEVDGERIKVEDYEGDAGWVHHNLISAKRKRVIVKASVLNVRGGPNVESERRFQAERGVILEPVQEKDGWLLVRHADGDEGWCSAKYVWGWKE